jgi:hypothetical protein
MIAVAWIVAVQASLVLMLFGSGYLDRRGDQRVSDATRSPWSVRR